MKTDIIAGIPSYNEEESISFVASQIDKGLVKYFPNKKCIIVNADNHSADGTKRNFLATGTKNKKLYLSTREGVKGKGNNFHNLFKLALELNAKSIMVADSDLRSITPEWVNYLLSPILEDKYDFISPYYWRHRYDATITNFICYPLIYGLLGFDIRQPIGGEFAFNQGMVKYWMSKKWDKDIRNFGIDIFMTLNAVFGNFRIGQVELGVKIHNPSGPKLNSMFDNVVATTFKIIWQNKQFWDKKIKKPKSIPHLFRSDSKSEKISSPPGIEEIKKMESVSINAEQWTEIVYETLKGFNKSENIEEFKKLYFSRFASFVRETKNLSQKKSELLIQKQAEIFFKKRDEMLNKISLKGL